MRSEYIDKKMNVVTVIMSIIVVFIHSINLHLYGDVTSNTVIFIEKFISEVLGSVAVPMFFVMSGYNYFYDYNPINLKDNLALYNKKIKSRIRSLFIPYILWNSIYYCVFVFVSNNSKLSQYMEHDAVEISISEILQATLMYKYNIFFWYIFYLMIFSLTGFIITAFLHKKWFIVIIVLIAFIGSRFESVYILYYYAYWLLGAYCVSHLQHFLGYKRTNFQKAICLVVFILLLFLRFSLTRETKFTVIDHFILMITVILSWFVIDLFIDKINCVLIWKGKTFFLYVAHPIIIDSIKKLIAKTLPHNVFFALGNYFVSIVCSIIIVYLVAKFLETKIGFVWKCLNGAR